MVKTIHIQLSPPDDIVVDVDEAEFPPERVPHYSAELGYYDNLSAYHAYHTDGNIYGIKVPWYEYSTSTLCVKTDSNINLVCEPSSSLSKGRDDYGRLNAFACVNVNAYVDGDGLSHVTAIEGYDDRFALDGSNGDVWVMTPVLYYSVDDDGNYQHYRISDTQHDGFLPFPGSKMPDGSLRPFMLYAKYLATKGDDGLISSVSGRIPWSRTTLGDGGGLSLSHQITKTKAKGDGYSGMGFAELFYLQIMFWIKYASKSSQTVFYGCNNYSRQYSVSIPENDVSRVIIPTASAANIIVGTYVSVGNSAAAPDRAAAAASSLADTVKVLSKTAYDASNTAIELDSEPFSTTEKSWITSMPWRTGGTDDVLGHDGSPIRSLNQSEPYKLQEIETGLGAYECLGNVMVNARIEDGIGYVDTYVAYDTKGLSASLNGNWVPSGQAAGVSGSWSYIKDVSDAGGVPGFLRPVSVGGSVSTGAGDGVYTNPLTSQGLREWLALGDLGYGASAGLACANLGNGAGRTGWNVAGRLSTLGRSLP